MNTDCGEQYRRMRWNGLVLTQDGNVIAVPSRSPNVMCPYCDWNFGLQNSANPCHQGMSPGINYTIFSTNVHRRLQDWIMQISWSIIFCNWRLWTMESRGKTAALYHWPHSFKASVRMDQDPSGAHVWASGGPLWHARLCSFLRKKAHRSRPKTYACLMWTIPQASRRISLAFHRTRARAVCHTKIYPPTQIGGPALSRLPNTLCFWGNFINRRKPRSCDRPWQRQFAHFNMSLLISQAFKVKRLKYNFKAR